MKKLILSVCCVAALVSSCKKTGSQGPEGPAGPQGPQGPAGSGTGAGTGIVTGKVKQYDQYNVQYTTNLNTTTVSVEGTTISTVTDASGNYSLTNVGAGVLDLVYNRPNSGLNKINQIVFAGAGTLFLNENVYDKASYTFSGGYAKDTTQFSNSGVLYRLYYTTNTKQRSAVAIFGKTASVDISDPSTYEFDYYMNIPANTTTTAQMFSYGNSAFNAFNSGDMIYVKIYPLSNTGSGYYNYVLNRQVLTGGGTPLPTTFVITKP